MKDYHTVVQERSRFALDLLREQRRCAWYQLLAFLGWALFVAALMVLK